MLHFVLCRQVGSCVLFVWQDKHNLCTLAICPCCKTGHKTSSQARFFLPVSKSLANKLYILGYYIFILQRNLHEIFDTVLNKIAVYAEIQMII